MPSVERTGLKRALPMRWEFTWIGGLLRAGERDKIAAGKRWRLRSTSPMGGQNVQKIDAPHSSTTVKRGHGPSSRWSCCGSALAMTASTTLFGVKAKGVLQPRRFGESMTTRPAMTNQTKQSALEFVQSPCCNSHMRNLVQFLNYFVLVRLRVASIPQRLAVWGHLKWPAVAGNHSTCSKLHSKLK